MREADLWDPLLFMCNGDGPFNTHYVLKGPSLRKLSYIVLFLQIAGNNNNMSKRKQVKKDLNRFKEVPL
ncbi:hypothetical protein SAMN05443529_105164 [Desulfosporosinus hippei DSM 8344]|uniref:Uncharacterized protein n=1 Tax=Desulfosporosinus hippei DSM 8344 TaxID=1121419 RepID=A0A1G7WI61_9FIRM|nr:hypothetical protein SAMN05443529_105164 [Desulfosporosinus hippei DSM 8344]